MLPAGTRQRIVVAGVITLGVTLVRLFGEIRHWDTHWFGSEAGGGGSLFGIAWLVLPFGWLFGSHLARSGAGPGSRLAAVLWPLAGIALAVGLISAMLKLMPEPTLKAFLCMCVIGPVCAAVGYRGWPTLWRTNLYYAIAARLPVIMITPIAVMAAWGTHYEKLAPNSPEATDPMRIVFLCVSQIVVWLPYTVLVGGLVGGIAAAVTRPRS